MVPRQRCLRHRLLRPCRSGIRPNYLYQNVGEVRQYNVMFFFMSSSGAFAILHAGTGFFYIVFGQLAAWTRRWRDAALFLWYPRGDTMCYHVPLLPLNIIHDSAGQCDRCTVTGRLIWMKNRYLNSSKRCWMKFHSQN